MWDLIRRMTCSNVFALKNLRSKVFNDLLGDLVRNDTICCGSQFTKFLSLPCTVWQGMKEMTAMRRKYVYALQRLDVRGLGACVAAEVHVLL